MSNADSSKVVAAAIDETEVINIETELAQLKKSDQYYIKRMETMNFERVHKLTRMRQRNVFAGVFISAAVLGIYAYTIGAVKQEGFLDDFDEPVPPSQREMTQ